MPFDYTLEVQREQQGKQATEDRRRVGEDETKARTRFGVGADNRLTWDEQQANPFSVTANLTRMFRQQRDAQKYGAFSGGYGSEGVSGFEAANLATDQQRQIYDTTNEFDDVMGGFGRRRLDIEAAEKGGSAMIDAQIHNAFDADQAAHVTPLGTAEDAGSPTAAGIAAMGLPASPAPQPNLVKRYSAAHKADWYYKVGASGKLIPVRPA